METGPPLNRPERRTNPRKRLFKQAVLNHRTLGLQACHIRDISLDGVFIDSNWRDLTAFTPVEVAVTLNHGAERREYRFPATVARITGEGVGLQFSSINMETYSALLEMLYTS